MNKLAQETSHYLLQHAHNPVEWYPWGEEAFEKARTEGKPILVSIGYSTCHWCHVMAHESFEDEQTAELMNKLYVNVKVDREERPDVDAMYMDAVQAMTGSGGWPLNVFITPEKQPFYGGTYFPPTRAYNRSSWNEVLVNVYQVYTQRPDEIEQQTDQLMQHLHKMAELGQKKSEEALDLDYTNLCNKILSNADKVDGGFGTAPKFPSTFSINYLLDAYALRTDEDALKQALLSLDKMALGGIYDQLGGGFARYSTDAEWFAPHFEKMLYDNALLLISYANAYGITKDSFYLKIIDETVQWLSREMINSQGAFYAAQDADSEGVEGKYYTWKHEELVHLLGEEANTFCEYFNIESEGNWLEVHTQERTNILFRKDKEVPSEKVIHSSKKLLAHRLTRVKPLTDDKILLAWNALMNKALTICALRTSNATYLEIAQKNMDYLLQHFASAESLYYHVSYNEVVKQAAFGDDLIYLCDALIHLSQCTGDTIYMKEAKRIMDYLVKHFSEKDDVLFSFTHLSQQELPINKKEIYDGATASLNSVACECLIYLGYAFNESGWTTRADDMLLYMQKYFQPHPSSFAYWANVAQRFKHINRKELVFIGPNARNIFWDMYNKRYQSNVLNIVSNGVEESISATAGKYKVSDTMIYVCSEQSCLPPVNSQELAENLIFST